MKAFTVWYLLRHNTLELDINRGIDPHPGIRFVFVDYENVFALLAAVIRGTCEDVVPSSVSGRESVPRCRDGVNTRRDLKDFGCRNTPGDNKCCRQQRTGYKPISVRHGQSLIH